MSDIVLVHLKMRRLIETEMPKEQGIALKTTNRDWFTIHQGASPVLGTAIHNGHEVKHEMEDQMALPEDERLEELEKREGGQGSLSNRELAVL